MVTIGRLKRLNIIALDKAVTVAAVAFWLGVLYWTHTQVLSRVQYGVAFLGGILALYALSETVEALESNDWIDLLVLAASAGVMVGGSAYFFANFEEAYVRRQGWALEHEYLLASLIITSVLYLTWREFGNLFLGLVAGAMAYAMFGYHAPGVLYHAGVAREQMLTQLVTDMYGFYGSLTQLTASWIAPFLLYAGLLFAYGAFDLILRIAIQAANYIRSGVAQTAVIASAIIGSINGSYTANAGMTGSFTIPTMKNSGMQPRTAAGIESVASTSGQVLPPVMGASAFVMASFLGIPYLDVIVAGLAPAVIMVTCIAIGVHYASLRDAGEQEMRFADFFDEPLSRSEKVVEGIRFGAPFVVLIYTLGVLQWTVMTAAKFTVVSMVVLGISTPVLQSIYAVATGGRSTFVPRDGLESSVGRLPAAVRDPIATVRRFRPVDRFVTETAKTVGGFREGAVILAPIAIILAAVNGVIDLFSVTGVPSKIALVLMDLSGGVLFFAVLLSMGICIMMGIGMTTVAAYVIVAILVAPTLIENFGIAEIAAHYLVFYAAVLAGITPPVATAAVVAAGIAGADFWRTCGVAIRIAAPLFILPVAFAYHPELVSTSLSSASLIGGLLTLAGGIAIIYGLNYPFRMRRLKAIPLRAGLFVLGFGVMVYPSWTVQAIGAIAFLGVFVGEKVVARGWRSPAGRGEGVGR